jgi:hypothetical protein
MKHAETNLRVSSHHYNRQEPRCVPSLHRAGNKQGNLGRPLFFEIGEQRDERHNIETRCRLKQNWLRRPAPKGEQWGELPNNLYPQSPKEIHTYICISKHDTNTTTHSDHKTKYRRNPLYISMGGSGKADPPCMDSTERMFDRPCSGSTTDSVRPLRVVAPPPPLVT